MVSTLRQRPGRALSSSATTTASSPLVSQQRPASSTKSKLDDDDGPDAYIEVESNLLHNMQDTIGDLQDTIGDSISKTNETVAATWRSTKASANETIRVVENQMSETWDASKAAFEGAKRLLRFEELPKEWQSNPYILTGAYETEKIVSKREHWKATGGERGKED